MTLPHEVRASEVEIGDRLWTAAADLLGAPDRRVGIYLAAAGSHQLRLCGVGRGEAVDGPPLPGSLEPPVSRASRQLEGVWREVYPLPGAPEGGGVVCGAVVTDQGPGGCQAAPEDISRLVAFVAAVHAHGAAHEELADRHAVLRQRHQALISSREVEQRLRQVSGREDAAQALVRACSELTGKVTTLFDDDGRMVAASGVTSGLRMHSFASVIQEWEKTEGPQVRAVSVRRPGLRDRSYLVAPVRAGARDLGWLIVVEQADPFDRHDRYVAGRAADQAVVELTVLRRVSSSWWNARSTLARQLVGGTAHPDDLRRACRLLGVDLEARRLLVFLVPCGADVEYDVEALATKLERQVGSTVLATRGSEGAVCLVDVPAQRAGSEAVQQLKEALGSLLDHDGEGCGLVAGVASTAERGGLGAAYREAREAAHCTVRFSGVSPTRVLAVDDLGPARVFLAARNDASMEGYVRQVLGRLVDNPADVGLLETLQTYLSSHGAVRVTADRLGIHENTVRLRLARVHEYTGLDVARDLSAQLSAHTALILLRLRGHPVATGASGPAIHW